MSDQWGAILTAIIIAAFGSSGFWAWFSNRDRNRKSTDKLIMGLAYDRIVFLGMRYIERGWITKDEFEDFQKYLYEPYLELGGNGVAKRIMQEITTLPFKRGDRYTEIVNDMRDHRRSTDSE